jgi:phosphoribosylanthranilate isomerase
MYPVKICGVTNLEDALAAAEAGASAIGFVFHPKSSRYVEPAVVQQIVGRLPPFVTPVGVFVDEEMKVVRDYMDTCGLRMAQLHGDETATYCRELNRPVLKAIRLKDRTSFLALSAYQGLANVRGFVLDAYSEGVQGGTGKVIDWKLAGEAAKTAIVILAGGLTPDNVAQAIRTARPYGVDVSTGVEAMPGIKDRLKMQAFIRAARVVSP